MFFVFVVLLIMLFVGYEIFCGFLKKSFCLCERERRFAETFVSFFKKYICMMWILGVEG